MKSQLAEVQTGFEPLFFHIQADFQWQRPFSEGCGGWISEKSKKNLSQSYGCWIVGFHEPMTSPLFAFKKGAKDWRYDILIPEMHTICAGIAIARRRKWNTITECLRSEM
jgi:hypothetical protein